MDYRTDRDKHRALMQSGTLSSKQAEDIIQNDRDRKSHEAIRNSMLQTLKQPAFKERKPKKTDTPPIFEKNEKTSSNSGGELFLAAVFIAFLVHACNPSSEEEAPAPQQVPNTEKILSVGGLSGKFVCAVKKGERSLFYLPKNSKAPVTSVSAVPENSKPIPKGTLPLDLDNINKYAVSCDHAEYLIRDYYRSFRPK